MTFGYERQVAVEAVTQAALLCSAIRREMVSPAWLEKGDKSPVTIADFASQALVCRYLDAAFPDDVIVAEEKAADLEKSENGAYFDQVTRYVQRFQPGATPRDVYRWIDAGRATPARRYWTLDPLDGTKGFLRNDQYAIALGLIVDGAVQVSALACPALPLRMNNPTGETGVLFAAVRGEGAVMGPLRGTPRPIHVAEGANGDGLRLVESIESAHGNPRLQEDVARTAGIVGPALRMDSQAKYGIVARGDAVLYLRLPSPASPDYREKIWDHAAGVLVVTEAGGRVTDIHGEPLDFASGSKMRASRGVVVSNGTFHDTVITALTLHNSSVARSVE